MPLDRLPELLLYILVVGYTPGPANLYALSCALHFGRRRALRMWQGLLVGFAVAVVTMAVLTHLLDEALGGYVIYLKYVGAAYILWLAVGMLRDKGDGDREATSCTFWSGVVMQLTNAKMLLFDLMVFSIFVVPYSDSLFDLLAVAALLLLAGPCGNLVWLLAGVYLRRFFRRFHRQVDVVMAILLVACAVMIVI